MPANHSNTNHVITILIHSDQTRFKTFSLRCYVVLLRMWHPHCFHGTNAMILMPQIYDVIANESARYNRNELKLNFFLQNVRVDISAQAAERNADVNTVRCVTISVERASAPRDGAGSSVTRHVLRGSTAWSVRACVTAATTRRSVTTSTGGVSAPRGGRGRSAPSRAPLGRTATSVDSCASVRTAQRVTRWPEAVYVPRDGEGHCVMKVRCGRVPTPWADRFYILWAISWYGPQVIWWQKAVSV